MIPLCSLPRAIKRRMTAMRKATVDREFRRGHKAPLTPAKAPRVFRPSAESSFLFTTSKFNMEWSLVKHRSVFNWLVNTITVHIRFTQATSWFSRYVIHSLSVSCHPVTWVSADRITCFTVQVSSLQKSAMFSDKNLSLGCKMHRRNVQIHCA